MNESYNKSKVQPTERSHKGRPVNGIHNTYSNLDEFFDVMRLLL